MTTATGTNPDKKRAPLPVPGGRTETVFAVALAMVCMLGPVLFIQWRYEDFVSAHGEIRAGADTNSS